MKSECNQIPPPHASVDEKITFIERVARLDGAAVDRKRAGPSGPPDHVENHFRNSPVGTGYNIFGPFADNSSIRQVVLDFAKLVEADLVSSRSINDNEVSIVSGETMQQVSQSFFSSVAASGSGGLGAASFSGGMEASFGKETMFRHEHSYAILDQLHRVAQVQLFSSDPAKLRKCMTPDAAERINSRSEDVNRVIDFYGTHVLCGAGYGARLEFSSATNKWAYEAKTSASLALRASFDSISGSGSSSAEFSSEEEKQQYEANTITPRQSSGRPIRACLRTGRLQRMASLDRRHRARARGIRR